MYWIKGVLIRKVDSVNRAATREVDAVSLGANILLVQERISNQVAAHEILIKRLTKGIEGN